MNQYIMKACLCGAAIPVDTSSREVTCSFCGNVYEVQRRNGKSSPQFGFFEGLLIGGVVGFLLGWPISRAALATTARVTITELERRAEEWGRR